VTMQTPSAYIINHSSTIVTNSKVGVQLHQFWLSHEYICDVRPDQLTAHWLAFDVHIN